MKKYCTTIGRNIALTSEQILDYDKKHHNNCKCCPLSLFFEGLVTMNVEIDVLIVRNIISVSKVTRLLDRSLIVFFKCLCHCCCLCHCLFVGQVFLYPKTRVSMVTRIALRLSLQSCKYCCQKDLQTRVSQKNTFVSDLLSSLTTGGE